MKKTILFLIVFFAVTFCFASPLFAFTTKGEEHVSISETISDDVYAFGNDVTLTGKIDGDFVSSASQITINGTISDDLMAAGGIITIGGEIGDSARIAGGMIAFAGKLKKDLVAAGGQIEVADNAVIDGDVILNGGKILINGNINGKMEISGADVTINGKIGKDVKISSSNIKIGDNAQISGNFSYTSGQEAVISPNAKISGKTSWTKTETGKGRDFKMTPDMKMGAFAAITATWLGGKAVSFLSFFILGLLLLRVIPKTFDKFSERMKKSPGICAGSGAIMVFGTPLGAFILIIVSILLFITLIGSGLGCLLIIADIAAMLFYSAVLFLSNIFLSFFIGRIILNKSMKNPDRYGWKVLAFLIGLVITSAVYAIPFAGWLAMFAGILFGSGGLIMIMKDWRSTHGKIQSS